MDFLKFHPRFSGNRDSGANLKKVLALVLAFACAFTMFAGAAFTDSADIKVDTEVVDTLVSLGVVNGYDDGSFKPNGTVTRAEMAKMIYVLRTGNSDASAYNDDKTSFTDIGSHWARGYIKYCQSLGIIAGKSNTKFCPNDKVTAQEAAKMLLVTLGYNAEKAGLTGAGWASKTNALADENGLLEDVTTSFTAACPRQYAAQLIYNAIFAHTVVLRDGEYTNMKLVTSADKGADNYNPTIGKKYMGLEETVDELTNISYDDDKDEFTYTIGTGSKAPTYKSSKDYSKLYGLNVDVLYKTTSNKTTVYGIYAKDSSIVASGVLGDLEIVKNDAKKIKIDGTEYKLTDTTSDVLMVEAISGTDFKKADTKSETFNNKLVDNAKLNPAITGAAQAYTFDLLDTTDDDKGDKIIVHPVTVAKVSYAGAKSITADINYKFEDHDIADGIKKDDYVVITPADNTAKHRANIVKAEVVTGKINGQKSSDVKVGDTWYTNVSGSPVSNGDTCDVVVLNGYAFNFDVTAETSKDILFVSAKDNSVDKLVDDTDGTLKVRAYFVDGTNKEIKVRKVNGKKVTAVSDVTAEALYTYKSTDDGYELTSVRNANGNVAKNLAGYDSLVENVTKTTADVKAYDNKKFVASSNATGTEVAGATYSIADDAVMFVIAKDGNSTEVKVMSGKAVNGWGNTTWGDRGYALVDEVNGINYVKVGTLVAKQATRPTASDDTQYGYLLEDAYTTTQGANDDKVIAYHIWTGSADTTVYEEYTTAPQNMLQKGAVIRYEVDGDYVTAISNTQNQDITADAANAKLVAITGIEYKSKGTVAYRYLDTSSRVQNTSNDMDEDCVYIAVDDANHVKHEGGLKDIATAKSETDGKKTANAWIFTDGATTNAKITAIVFDVPNNEIKADNNEF